MKILTDSQTAPMTKEQWLTHNAHQLLPAEAKVIADLSEFGLVCWVLEEDGSTAAEIAESTAERDQWFHSVNPDGTLAPKDERTKTYWLVPALALAEITP